jgi:chorismate-pyruvate lyase
MEGVANLSSLESALSRASGTVTAFLEHLVGEPIDAGERCHTMTNAEIPNSLGVVEGHPLIFRTAALRGRMSGRSYLYAESFLVPSRLPANCRQRLESSSDPIGRILEEEGITITREPLGGPGPSFAPVSPEVGITIGDYLLARTYRIDAEGTPLMVITEWFLASLRGFLGSRAESAQ